MKLKIIYVLLFFFSIWLALATRSHSSWFPKLVVEYGGDVIWAGMFVFLLRTVFSSTKLWKLSFCTYLAGVAVEVSQLFSFGWLAAIRKTYIGRLMLGVGFLWSDLICYGIGVFIASVMVLGIEKIKWLNGRKGG